MSVDILDRTLWAALIVAGGLAAYWLLNRWILHRAQRTRDAAPAQFFSFRPGTAAVLYFTTPDCVACKAVQAPVLRQLQDQLGDRLQVIEVDAQAQPDLASRWGVLSVPTTFILDRHGQLRHVNHGVTRADKLIRQIQSG